MHLFGVRLAQLKQLPSTIMSDTARYFLLASFALLLLIYVYIIYYKYSSRNMTWLVMPIVLDILLVRSRTRRGES